MFSSFNLDDNLAVNITIIASCLTGAYTITRLALVPLKKRIITPIIEKNITIPFVKSLHNPESKLGNAILENITTVVSKEVEGIDIALKEIKQTVNNVNYELSYNSGSSIKDAISRIEKQNQDLAKKHDEEFSEVKQSIEDLRLIMKVQYEENKIRFRELIVGIDLALIELDKDLKVVHVNPAWTELTGYSAMEAFQLQGTGLFYLVDEEEKAEICDYSSQHIEASSSQVGPIDYHMVRKNGEKILVRATRYAIKDKNKNIVGWLGSEYTKN